MASVADRVQWVLDSRRVENASAWAVKAKLPRTYLSAFLFRVRQGIEPDMGVRTAQALALAANVNPGWLAFGYGLPDDPLEMLPPNLAAVVTKNPNAFPEKLVVQAAMLPDVIGEKDVPEDVWRDYLESLRKEARRVAFEVTAVKLDNRGVKR